MSYSSRSSAVCASCSGLVRQLSAGQLETHLDLRAGVWCAGGAKPRIGRMLARRWRWMRLFRRSRSRRPLKRPPER